MTARGAGPCATAMSWFIIMRDIIKLVKTTSCAVAAVSMVLTFKLSQRMLSVSEGQDVSK